jgi:hypothetical protein
MADWHGSARSNYFLVKDRQAFSLALAGLSVQIVDRTNWIAGQGEVKVDERVALLSDDEYGGWPSYRSGDDVDEDEQIDLPQIVSEHLADGEVAVFMECGAEKLRYVTGTAVAVNSKGDTRTITLRDIYDQATQLGEVCTEAAY